ncbi:T9SS type A sorting domain-containing protein [Dyadobacter sp. LHD-138]|uniref:T9SS type A sorting domain-containing protein n=1 Tax=Dyadobacter sp. LHD-138 TaxID=3071413 RepID=UPI0027E0DD50|nr:T9SS type A sorting domain-containing protein [Dyadobacter sp. LHD-138]MDQ6477215.1 T9SS type A sorting domain-containing protein [Dyadobacter sp. LHD-138]
MKKLQLLLVLWLVSLYGWAQCPTGNVTLVSQQDVTNFVTAYPSCTTITGNLTIGDPSTPALSNITSLQGLSGITSIQGELTVSGNRLLTTLAGLGTLATLGSLDISYNTLLNSITALSNMHPLNSSTFDVNITHNDVLASIKGLEGISQARMIVIHNSTTLQNLEGLNNLASASMGLSLFGNGLNSLQGLESLTSLGGLVLSTNPNLVSLQGLHNLTRMDQGMFQGNNALSNFKGLENLSTVQSLSIGLHTSLTSLEGLGNFPALNQFVLIQNPLLTSCAVKPICQTLGNTAAMTQVQNNGLGCNSIAQIEAACLVLPVTLADFKVKAEGNTAQLTWTTTAEANSDYFEIQVSNDARKWLTLGNLSSHGDSGQTNHYSFTHQKPLQSIQYYRLRMVDRDGSAAFSQIRSLTFTSLPMVLYPNPTTDRVQLVNEDWQDIERLQVVDVHGKVVLEQKGDFEKGISLNQQPAGLYVLNLYSLQGVKSTFKVLKK